jgi:spore germination cell wall hydrolase CwlJ-like protein
MRKPSRYFWSRAETVARAALGGYVYAPVGLATHYHTFAVHPIGPTV